MKPATPMVILGIIAIFFAWLMEPAKASSRDVSVTSVYVDNAS